MMDEMYSQLAERMVLTDIHDGWSFSLGIWGFQFEETEGLGREDLEWLRVSLAVHSPDATWKWTDSCLLFSEAKELAKWLRDVAAGDPSGEKISFTEPEIAFQAVLDSQAEARVTVCIYYPSHRRKGFAEKWGSPDTACQDKDAGPPVVSRDFIVARPNLLEASTALLENLRRLPKREGLSV
jgi:hypothetical protein